MLALSTIGEELVAAMYSRSAEVRDCFGSQTGPPVEGCPQTAAIADIQLHRCGDFRFDGTHCVDVGFVNKKVGIITPCEIKLGFDRLSAHQFTNRFLTPGRVSRHVDGRIAGNMIAILDGKLPPVCATRQITATIDGRFLPLTPNWFLMLRHKVLVSWAKTGFPSLSNRCALVDFEEVVEAFGGEGIFNELVRELTAFNYYDQWMGVH